jgi:hypothetical protein
MFNPTASENSRHDGIGVLEIVSHYERAPSQTHLFVPLKRAELRGGAVGPLAALQLTQVYGHAVDGNGDARHYGYGTLNGSYIFGDYDLFDVVIPSQANCNLAAVEELHGPVHMRGARGIPVQNYINNRTGVKMVNHGGQAQAMHKFQEVDAFGPGGEQEHWTAAEVQQQYALWKRSTL